MCQGCGRWEEEQQMELYDEIYCPQLKAMCFNVQRGMAQLPDLHVSDSSEAMLRRAQAALPPAGQGCGLGRAQGQHQTCCVRRLCGTLLA